MPAGTAAGLAVLASYLFAYEVANMPLVEARTVATTVLVFVGLYLILALEGRRTRARRCRLDAVRCARDPLHPRARGAPLATSSSSPPRAQASS